MKDEEKDGRHEAIPLDELVRRNEGTVWEEFFPEYKEEKRRRAREIAKRILEAIPNR